MGSEFFEQVAALSKEGRPFAVATVVARRPPVSAHLGDRAIIFADGRMEGFVGGACAREIVRRQAVDAIRARQARLVSISPNPGTVESTDEHVVVPMTCASEGAVDVYVEPFVQARTLVVAGATPVAAAVARLARAMDFDVVRIVDSRELADVQSQAAEMGVKVASLDAIDGALAGIGPDAAAVVASQGHYDEEALAAVLGAGLAYVGLVASRKRGAIVCGLLEERSLPDVSGIRFPAGLDLGAKTPAEVALSILAEIVQVRPMRTSKPLESRQPAGYAIDPVCQMQVEIAAARHTADVGGVRYYFCCAGCESRFVKEPDAFRPAPAP
jgi:xanthine dehydrogenase accessory factor